MTTKAPDDDPEDPIVNDGPEDPIMEAHIERAIAPYRRFLSPQDLAFLREELILIMETHPAVAPRVDRLRQRAGLSSGDFPRSCTPVPAESETRPRRTKGGGGR